METSILKQIGLSENEIKVYFALLELDESTATPIVRRAEIPNSKIYPTLDRLIKKGLVSFVMKNKVKHYQAADPNNLIEYLNDKEKLIEQQKKSIAEIIPQIEARKAEAKEKNSSAVYEGYDGIKAAFNLILSSLQERDEYLVFSMGQELKDEKVLRFYDQYHKKRVRKGLKLKFIHMGHLERNFFDKHYLRKNMKVKYTDQLLPTGIYIFGNNVMTVVWGEKPAAFVITSKLNAERYRIFFNQVWERSED